MLEIAKDSEGGSSDGLQLVKAPLIMGRMATKADLTLNLLS